MSEPVLPGVCLKVGTLVNFFAKSAFPSVLPVLLHPYTEGVGFALFAANLPV